MVNNVKRKKVRDDLDLVSVNVFLRLFSSNGKKARWDEYFHLID